jgi:hypothetical protein
MAAGGAVSPVITSAALVGPERDAALFDVRSEAAAS